MGLSDVVSSRDWRELAVEFSDVVKREDTGQRISKPRYSVWIILG